jgi:hypothetical protein
MTTISTPTFTSTPMPIPTPTPTTTPRSMSIPPISPQTRSLSFQGASTLVHYRRFIIGRDDPGGPSTAAGRRTGQYGGAFEGSSNDKEKGKGRAEPGLNSYSEERWTVTKLDGFVKSTWEQGRSPDVVGLPERHLEGTGSTAYWMFGWGEVGIGCVMALGDRTSESSRRPLPLFSHIPFRSITGPVLILLENVLT